MALNVDVWNALSNAEKDNVVNFLRGNCKIDLEHPENSQPTPNSYPITDGTTKGGHPMKYGEEYRIYITNIIGIPPFLDAELKDRGTKNRVGGSQAIRAIKDYGHFDVGKN